MQRKILPLLALFGSGLAVYGLYLILHEAGHAAVGLLLGQRPAVFAVRLGGGSHVEFAGRLTRTQQALISLGGVLLPLAA